MTIIYHLTTRDAARTARQSGVYHPESLSREGMIHFSTADQLLDVANNFYAGQKNLVVLAVDVAKLDAELKYEAPVHPAGAGPAPVSHSLFPHLYGPLKFDAVVAVYDFEPGLDGRFSLPAGLGTDH